jgi:Iodothyronine deiodinase
MEEIYQRSRDQVAFFVVYVQEAHPTDGWQVDSNVQEGILYRQHQTFDERETVANACSLDLRLPLPILVEEMDNAIDEAYGAAPERLYVIGADGRVAYQGGAGPHFFDPDEWEQAIQVCVKTGSHVDTKAS